MFKERFVQASLEDRELCRQMVFSDRPLGVFMEARGILDLEDGKVPAEFREFMDRIEIRLELCIQERIREAFEESCAAALIAPLAAPDPEPSYSEAAIFIEPGSDTVH